MTCKSSCWIGTMQAVCLLSNSFTFNPSILLYINQLKPAQPESSVTSKISGAKRGKRGFTGTHLQTLTHCTWTVQPLYWGCNTTWGLGHPILERTLIFFVSFLLFSWIKASSVHFPISLRASWIHLRPCWSTETIFFIFCCRVFPSHVSQHPRNRVNSVWRTKATAMEKSPSDNHLYYGPMLPSPWHNASIST